MRHRDPHVETGPRPNSKKEALNGSTHGAFLLLFSLSSPLPPACALAVLSSRRPSLRSTHTRRPGDGSRRSSRTKALSAQHRAGRRRAVTLWNSRRKRRREAPSSPTRPIRGSKVFYLSQILQIWWACSGVTDPPGAPRWGALMSIGLSG